MTSNLGSDLILDGISEDGELSEQAKQGVTALLRSHFRPEFLNRIDETVFFTPLSREQIRRIIDLQLARLRERLKEKELDFTLTEAAIDRLMAQGYDPIYGARPMKRLLQSKIETLIARKLVSGDIEPGTTLVVDVNQTDGFQIN